MKIFTGITNVAMDTALEKNLTSENAISAEVYPLVKDLPIPTYYIPPAITRAIAMVKGYRRSLRGRKAEGIDRDINACMHQACAILPDGERPAS